jgi:hypothetical protein
MTVKHVDAALERAMRGVACALAVVVLLGGPAAAQLQCRGGTIVFYPEGELKSCEIEGIHELWTEAGWVKCASGHPATKHAGGKLESCVLFEARRFGPRDCTAGARVRFDPDGTFRRCD